MKRLRALRDFDPVPPGTCRRVEARLRGGSDHRRRVIGPVTLTVLALATISFAASAAVSIVQRVDAHSPTFRETRFEMPPSTPVPPTPAKSPAAGAIPDLPSEEEDETMNVKKIVACATTVSALATAQTTSGENVETREAEPKILYPSVQRMDFDPSLLTAEVTTPDQVYIHVRSNAKFECLIEVRSDFRDQLLRSVDEL